jgi:hypothetical protein
MASMQHYQQQQQQQQYQQQPQQPLQCIEARYRYYTTEYGRSYGYNDRALRFHQKMGINDVPVAARKIFKPLVTSNLTRTNAGGFRVPYPNRQPRAPVPLLVQAPPRVQRQPSPNTRAYQERLAEQQHAASVAAAAAEATYAHNDGVPRNYDAENAHHYDEEQQPHNQQPPPQLTRSGGGGKATLSWRHYTCVYPGNLAFQKPGIAATVRSMNARGFPPAADGDTLAATQRSLSTHSRVQL